MLIACSIPAPGFYPFSRSCGLIGRTASRPKSRVGVRGRQCGSASDKIRSQLRIAAKKNPSLFTIARQAPLSTQGKCGSSPLSLGEANKTFRNNTDPKKTIQVDASQLTVRQTQPFNAKGTAPGVVQGSDWLVHGSVTLRKDESGNISLRPDKYSFEQHDVSSFREFVRNIETYAGFYVATYGGLSEYWADLTGGNHATDFNFEFSCQPTVVQ